MISWIAEGEATGALFRNRIILYFLRSTSSPGTTGIVRGVSASNCLFFLSGLMILRRVMLRRIIAVALVILLIGIVVLGVWLISGHGDATPLSTGADAEPADARVARRDSKGFARSRSVTRPARGARGAAPELERTPEAQPPPELAVSEALASELNLTDTEREQANALIAGMLADRRKAFDEMTHGDWTREDLSEEMGHLRRRLNADMAELLGGERAEELLRALRRRKR